MKVLHIDSWEELVKFTSQKDDIIRVVKFSTTWCGPCVKDEPKYQQLYEKVIDKSKIVFASLYFDKWPAEDADEMQTTHDITRLPSYKCFCNGSAISKNMSLAELQTLILSS